MGFGNSEWEFGIIAQTFDAMPTATMGMLLLALGLRARDAGKALTRTHAAVCALVALVIALLLVIFSLDIPVAWRAMTRVPPGGGAPQTAVVIAGIKRGIAKAVLFGVVYLVTYAMMARMMWRRPRTFAA